MLQMTIIRVLAVIISAVILYWCLMIAIRWKDKKIIRKRRRNQEQGESMKSRIVLFCMFLMCLFIILCFVFIKFRVLSCIEDAGWERSVKIKIFTK